MPFDVPTKIERPVVSKLGGKFRKTNIIYVKFWNQQMPQLSRLLNSAITELLLVVEDLEG